MIDRILKAEICVNSSGENIRRENYINKNTITFQKEKSGTEDQDGGPWNVFLSWNDNFISHQEEH